MLASPATKLPASCVPVRREIRFAIVLYGGVSLAIYENRIALEFLRLVRSTARKTWNSAEYRFAEKNDRSGSSHRDESNDGECLRGTETVYRELARRLSEPEAGNGVRFVVDVISGTSAGGINGIFLAKALANDQSLQEVKKLWVEEAEISKLLNDRPSVEDVDLPVPKTPASLLNGQRMYWKLLDAFDSMDQAPTEKSENLHPGTPAEPLVDELELYVTTTDIRGRVTPLRTYDRLVFERRHRFAFEFAFAPRAGCESKTDGKLDRLNPNNSFEYCDNPVLALAARCTSSFPFAFEPMTLQLALDVLDRRQDSRRSRVDYWRKNFFAPEHLQEETEASFKIEDRSFGDGGYVDNKPFGFAIDALARHTGVVPSERKLVFIEPAPEHPERDWARNRDREKLSPNALENVWAALVSVPGYETIREDLLRVNERGRLVRKVNDLIGFVLNSVDRIPSTHTVVSVSELSKTNLPAASYLTLRAFDLTDTLANVISKVRGVSRHSSYFYAIRSLVRALRERNYQGAETSFPLPTGIVRKGHESSTLIDFLRDFDLWYHLRRLRFVAGEIARLYKLDGPAVQRLAAWSRGARPIAQGLVETLTTSSVAAASFRRGLDELSIRVGESFSQLRETERTLTGGKARSAIDRAFERFAGEDQSGFLTAQLGVKAASSSDAVGKAYGLSGLYSSVERSDDDYIGLARDALIRSSLADEAFAQVGNALSDSIRSAIEKHAFPDLDIAVDADSYTVAAASIVRRYFEEFEQFDCVVFPVLYETDIGTLDTVDIIRFSPEDATLLVDENREHRYKLAGIALGHFGGFLEKEWRRFDMIWGRLDAAERIIRSLMPARAEQKEVEALVKQAHDEVLLEELGDRALQALLKDIGDLSPPLEKSRTSQVIDRLRAWTSQTDGGRSVKIDSNLP
jgi:patatin-related protein